MTLLELGLPVIWAALIGTAIALYVLLDGFDLGVAILYPLFKTDEAHDQMMNSIAPFWDGNETWLVLGGGGLWVAFPKAYAVIMPALYLPITVMLLALVFRGVAFEFRWIAKPHHAKWNIAFTLGSLVAAFSQGVVLGGLLQGIVVKNGQFAGGPLDWFTPFSLLCGISLIIGYALLGATWLMMKTHGPVAEHARKIAKPLLLGLVGAIIAVSIWTPLAIPRIAEFWFSLPRFFYILPIPALTVFATWLCWMGISDKRHDLQAFFSALAIFLLAYFGLVLSNIPYLVPPSITIWQAAAVPESQLFFLFGTLILLPLVLCYTVFVYWTFRGKLRPNEEGYH